ncbi:Endonuclease/exonuclease/phosphatase [Xylaria venustula]|nr:Endonuclease/exonuclease/phosphatase [Xylaria venustula]
MNEAVKKIIQEVEQARKPADSVPWAPDKPHAQPIFAFDSSSQAWTASNPTPTSPIQPHPQDGSKPTKVKKLALLSWNIDFMLPHANLRMQAGLAELRSHIEALPPDTASVIFLQECVPGDLDTIGATAWVQAGFLRTDIDNAGWASRAYGTTTLVDRRLAVANVFRAHYALTRMDRDALFVDVVVRKGEGEGEGEDEGDGKIIRFCNTHLESLALEPPYRPPQVALAARFMQEGSVHGALLAGDLNAIQPFDRTLHSANGLRDAYLELGGQEDSEEGYTWGQQAPPEFRKAFGCSRMDKVFYCGGVSVDKFARFGADIEVEGDNESQDILSWGEFEKAWITDHLGVFAEISVVD